MNSARDVRGEACRRGVRTSGRFTKPSSTGFVRGVREHSCAVIGGGGQQYFLLEITDLRAGIAYMSGRFFRCHFTRGSTSRKIVGTACPQTTCKSPPIDGTTDFQNCGTQFISNAGKSFSNFEKCLDYKILR